MGLTSSKSKRASFGVSSSFKRIADSYRSIDEVQAALRREGLESCNLIVAIDCTKSNEWTGKISNAGRSLHSLDPNFPMNPYQMAIHIIGRTLSAFDDDNLIPCYGFGDVTTGDRRVFSFKANDQPCVGVVEAEAAYRAVMPYVKLSGPTSFAPAIHQALKIVAQSGNQMHILLLIADGQVTRASDTSYGQLSPQEKATIDAIVEASNYPLSIVMVGVGDGPWDAMKEFDDNLPQRRFDNFQFVQMTSLMHLAHDPARLEAQFALQALMEVPEQFKTIQRMGLLGSTFPLRVAVPPPAPCPYPAAPAYAPPAEPAGATHYPRIDSSKPTYGTGPALATSPSYDGRSSQGTEYHSAQLYGQTSSSGWAGDRPSAGTYGHTSAGSARLSTGAPDALFICPITQEVMNDPVMAADGYSYERSAIEEWLRTHDTSPMSNGPLSHKNLTPNFALRSSIQEYRTAHGLL